jgi:phage shock protein A
MLFELQDFHDLVRLLREHPDWREELRALLLTQELLTLPGLVRELAETVAQLADRMDQLTQTVAQLAEEQRRLAEEQRRLTEG